MESSKEIKRLDTRSIESLYEKLSNETTQLLGLRIKPKIHVECYHSIHVEDKGDSIITTFIR